MKKALLALAVVATLSACTPAAEPTPVEGGSTGGSVKEVNPNEQEK